MTEKKDIPVDKLHIDPVNIRPEPNIDPEFIDSIKDEGLLHPLVVRSHNGEYGVVVGSRRLEAARRAELDEVPCTVRDDLEGNDKRAKLTSFKENKHREDIPPWRIKEFVNEQFKATDGRKGDPKRIKEVANRLNVSHQTVRRYVDIEKLDSTLNIRMKAPSKRTKEERERLREVFSEKSHTCGDEAEGFNLEKEEAEGFPSLKKVSVKVAEILSDSDFFLELQEEDPEKAHEIATEAAEAGRKQAPKVITSWKKELKEPEEEEIEVTLGSGRKPVKFMVTLGPATVDALDAWAEGRDSVRDRGDAARDIIFDFLREKGYHETFSSDS